MADLFSERPAKSPHLRTLLSWIDSNDFPWMPPWPVGGNTREREIQTLRRHARWLIRQDLVAKQGWARTLTQAAVWPLMAPIKVIRELHDRGIPFGKKEWLRELTTIWRLQVIHNLRIADQSEFRLDSPERIKLRRHFLSCREQQILLARAAEVRCGYPKLNDKRTFARFCEEHGLPHPRTLMSGEGANVSQRNDWPASDLILKPADLWQGQGIEIIRFDAASHTWRATDGTTISPETLPAYAGKQLRNGPWILQPCLVNPPAWQSLTPGPLSTVRVVTGIVARGGEPILVGIHAHLPVQSPFVANTAAGGITVSLDPDTGRMRIGYRWTDRAEDCRVHPVTGGPIEGAVLPDWEALRDLALRAHRAAGDWCTLGWDVASTNQGPMLIESNILWGAMSYVPQGHMPFIEAMQTVFGHDYAGIRAHSSPR